MSDNVIPFPVATKDVVTDVCASPRRYDIVNATPVLVREIAGDLREQDEIEARALAETPLRGLWRSYRSSNICRVAMVDGKPAAIWGLVVQTFGCKGNPWLMTTPVIERIPWSFFREGRAQLDQMLEICPTLEGYVLAEYDQAIGFLLALGFDIEPPVPHGKDGVMFCRYVATRSVVLERRRI